jgi:hypothetical protein
MTFKKKVLKNIIYGSWHNAELQNCEKNKSRTVVIYIKKKIDKSEANYEDIRIFEFMKKPNKCIHTACRI